MPVPRQPLTLLDITQPQAVFTQESVICCLLTHTVSNPTPRSHCTRSCPWMGGVFDGSMCFLGSYHEGDFMRTSLSAYVLRNANRIGRRVRRRLKKSNTPRLFSPQATEPAGRTDGPHEASGGRPRAKSMRSVEGRVCGVNAPLSVSVTTLHVCV